MDEKVDVDPFENVKTSRYRLVILLLYSLNAFLNAFTFVQYTTITDPVARFYDVEVSTVDWTTLSYGLSCSFPIFFGSWFLENKGLRWTAIASVSCTLLGNIIKCFSIDPSRFYLVIVGQVIAGFGQAFMYPTPPRLSSDWFPADEIAKASAVCVFSFQGLGGLTYVITTSVMHDVTDKDILKRDFEYLEYGLCVLSVVVFILTVVGFRSKPDNPPSIAVAIKTKPLYACPQKEDKHGAYWASIKRLLKNKNFLVHVVSYTLMSTVYNSTNVVIFQVLSHLFPGHMKEIGYLGCYLFVMGVPGCLLAGFYLDRKHNFKGLSLFLYAVCVIWVAVLCVMGRTVDDINWLYIPLTFLGMAFVSYLSVGYEFGAEMTYPESAATMACLLTAVGQCVTVIVVPISTRLAELVHDKGDILMLSLFDGLLVIGLIITVFIKPDYRRQTVERTNSVRSIRGSVKGSLRVRNGEA